MLLRLKKYIKSLRQFRVVHRLLGISLALFLVISAVTGVLLALKKDIAIIQPKTQKGKNFDLKSWKSIETIAKIAETALYAAEPTQVGNPVNRLDVRPSKGVVKVLFDRGYWEVQVDPATGEVKSIAKRHSDWIESLHDGSIVSDLFKLISMNFLGIGLLVLIVTGLWLWYGPKRIRRIKQNLHNESLEKGKKA